jgi:amidase
MVTLVLVMVLVAQIGDDGSQVVEASITDLQALMESGEMSAEAIARAYLTRIAHLDGDFGSVIVTNPEALAQARALDQERADRGARGPLHGIPILLKDNIESRDPMPTTAGSLALAGNLTDRDAFMVARLREAGAVILGKTNLSEWANFRSESSSSGWSGVGGQTHNPYDTSCNPCGSSSGSGVAVAASFAAVAIGTETNGSVVCPSTANGVVGIKPTVGLVSRSGVVPISHSQDTAGPMARSVADGVVLLSAMIGRDPADQATELADAAADWSLSAHLRTDGLAGKRIGVVRSLAGFHSEVDQLLEAAIADLEAAGATVVDELAYEGRPGLSAAAYDLLLYEFKHDLNAYLTGLPGIDKLPATTLEELIAFNIEHADEEMPFFGQEIFEKSQAKGPLTDSEYTEALALVQSTCREGIDRLLAEHDLDALIAPTGAPAWKTDHINGDHFLGGSSSFPARAGYPNITVPMGMVDGLPVGLSFFASALAEPTLIEMTYAYEQATMRRVAPDLPMVKSVIGSAWSILPPVVAIALALVFRDVLVSLFLGVWIGTTMLTGGLGTGFLRVIGVEVRTVLTDPDRISIVIFSMLLGGMVAVMSRSGGTHGVVKLLEPLATTPRRAQVVTWLMGICIFFDDYTNTLLVGNAMRPVTDRHSVSREKLAYLVDSTAAPVACVALISTWIGYQVSLLNDAFAARGADLNPFSIFIASLPYAFYPFFALVVTVMVAATGRDWGPMLKAERRAQQGELLDARAQPLADYESSGVAPDDDTPRRWWNAALPVVSVVVVTVIGLYMTGRQSLIEAGETDLGLRRIIGESDPFVVLLWGSLVGLTVAILLAVGQRILSLRDSLSAAVLGLKSMLMAVIVLTLAWSLGEVCTHLATADFLVAQLGSMPPGLIPVGVFVVAAAVSFATGTSWGTMGILTPLAIPLILASDASATPELAATVSAILGGSVFGDHCSPISDTTIMSSMASGCDHVDHVRTQLPYSMLAALVALLVCYLPGALLGFSIWLLPIGLILIVMTLLLLAKRVG